MRFFKREDSAEATVFRDVTFQIIAAFAIIVYIIIPWFNPITKQSTVQPPGELIFSISWPGHLDIDVDMWVKTPERNVNAVGYSNKVSKQYALLRDDIGFRNDPMFGNYEFGAAKKAVKGEWIVNLHYYVSNMTEKNEQGAVVEVIAPPVEVAISVIRQTDDTSTVWMTKTMVLAHKGQEITAFRFKVDDDGNLVEDSIGSRCVHLRDKNRGTPC